MDEIVTGCRRFFLTRSAKVMFIHGDKDLDFSRIAGSIAIARSAGVDHVGIITPGIVAKGIVANR